MPCCCDDRGSEPDEEEERVDERERDLGRGMGEVARKEGRADILFEKECFGVRFLGGKSIGEE